MTPEAQIKHLDSILSLAALFSTCVEAFGLIHPSKALDYEQKLALTRLGIQQGRLLIFGDAVGIPSPPATIATHMVPSHVGATNPDPTSPIFFDPRDPRLDEPKFRKEVEATLSEIVDRPAHLSREEMMELYGMKPPKRLTYSFHPALDTNRLEYFREKYDLLQDLSQSLADTRGLHRSQSMTTQHWQIHDVEKFSTFVDMVRDSVDKLIQLFNCKERIDRCMKADIRALGWHPEMAPYIIKRDLEKLKVIRATCKEDYPEYVPVSEVAMNYISQELNEDRKPFPEAISSPVSEKWVEKKEEKKEKEPDTKEKEEPKKRTGLLSYLKLSNLSKSKKSKEDPPAGNQMLAVPNVDYIRSNSEDLGVGARAGFEGLTPVRSLSLPSATPEMAALALSPPAGPSRKNCEAIRPDYAVDESDEAPLAPVNTEVSHNLDIDHHTLERTDTVNSFVERHDDFKGIPGIETADIRIKAT